MNGEQGGLVVPVEISLDVDVKADNWQAVDYYRSGRVLLCCCLLLNSEWSCSLRECKVGTFFTARAGSECESGGAESRAL